MTSHDRIDDSWGDEEITQVWRRQTGARVVVVDDDMAMRSLVASRLTAEGYDVHDAVSGDELLDVIDAVRAGSGPLDGVDLIVLDNRMPGITGLQAIRSLRAANCETPCILMTAFPERAVLVEAAILGVSVLPKPFSLDLLTTATLLTLLPAPPAPPQA